MTTHAAEEQRVKPIFDQGGIFVLDDNGSVVVSVCAPDEGIEAATTITADQRFALARALAGPEHVIVWREDAQAARTVMEANASLVDYWQMNDVLERLNEMLLTPTGSDE